MDWTIIHLVTKEMTVLFGGMVMIGEYTKCYVLRPCEENFLSPMPYGPKYFHQLTPNKSKSKSISSQHCLSAGEILQDHIVNAESRDGAQMRPYPKSMIGSTSLRQTMMGESTIHKLMCLFVILLNNCDKSMIANKSRNDTWLCCSYGTGV